MSNTNENLMKSENALPETPEKKKAKKLRKGSLIVNIIGLTIFSIYALSLLGSLGYTFLNSLKTRREYMNDVVSLPQDWLFSNYVDAFNVLSAKGNSFIGMFWNTLWLSVLNPTIHLFTGAMAAYVMAKYKFPGRSIIWGIMITTMVIPIYGATASTYKMYNFLGFYDSPTILLRSIASLGGGMMLIAAFEGVSTTYMEAGFLDGAGHTRVFFTIMLPQIVGLLTALWIMEFVGEWNNYMRSIMYLPSYPTLMTGLYIYQKENSRTLNNPILFAGALICSVPTVVLYMTFQDKFMNLSYGGGIKG